MKIQYLGTGAAEGVPAVFCNCPTCVEVRKRGGREIHTRSQIIIDGVFGIEFPPDSYIHSVMFNADMSALKDIIVTHSHMDHFYAHDFILRGYKYSKNLSSQTLCIYGNSEVKEVFSECTRREMKEEIAKNISVNVLKAYNEYDIGGYKVTPLRAQHSNTEEAFVYLIEKDGKSYLHLTDTGRLYGEVYEYLKEKGKHADAVCFDCTLLYDTKGDIGRHMGIEDNMAVKEKLLNYGICDENTKYYITHFSHNGNPLSEVLDGIEKKYGVKALYDGTVVEV